MWVQVWPPNEAAATSAFSELLGILNCRQENVDYRGLYSRTKGISLPVPKLLQQGCYKVFTALQGGKTHCFHPSSIKNKWIIQNIKHHFKETESNILQRQIVNSFSLSDITISALRLWIHSPQHPGGWLYYHFPFFSSLPFNRQEKGLWASNSFVKSHTPNWELNQILNPDVWTLEPGILPTTQYWFPVKLNYRWHCNNYTRKHERCRMQVGRETGYISDFPNVQSPAFQHIGTVHVTNSTGCNLGQACQKSKGHALISTSFSRE